MSTLRLLLAEIHYRKLNFLLSLLAVTVAVALFVAGPMLVDGYGLETRAQLASMEKATQAELDALDQDTRKIMRSMGFNLLIVPRETNMADFWAEGFAQDDMPQEYVDRLAADRRLTLVTHLVATLKQRVKWEDRRVLLVGYLPETTQSHLRHESPMGYKIAAGTVFLGYELGVGRKVGDTVEIEGKPFKVARLLPERGDLEDITIAVHLDDAQAVLNKPGRINQILALGCNCAEYNLPNIRKQLADVLPEARITEFQSIALARAEQRNVVAAKNAEIQESLADSRGQVERTLNTLVSAVTPVVVMACGVWLGLLALANVRERRTEIGLWRALGKGTGTIASLFLGKAVLLGFFGAAAGYLVGLAVGRWLGTTALDVTAAYFAPRWDVLLYALLGAPLLSALASYLPTVSALLQDPAVVLREV